MKTCSRCKIDKAESCFSKDFRARSGLKIHCRDCEASKKREWYVNNSKEFLAHKKLQYAADIDKFRAQANARRAADPEKFRAQERARWGIKDNLRSRVRAALKGKNKSARTLELLSCTIPELRAHLEKSFRPGMTWENYGPVWHIDHIKPCAKFDLTDPAQQGVCFSWANLQPLFAEENLKKGDRYAG